MTAATKTNERTITRETLASGEWTREELEGFIELLRPAADIPRIGQLIDAAQARLQLFPSTEAPQQEAA